MKLLIVQKEPHLANIDANLKIIENSIKEQKVQIELAIFPEMFLTGYMIRDKFYCLVQNENTVHIKKLKKIARKYKTALICGAPFEDSHIKGKIYNTALYITPTEKLFTQEKVYVPNFGPFEELLYFTAGKESKVYSLNEHKLGIQICYDLSFPEVSKSQALNGAELLVCISASPSSSRTVFEKLCFARAIENCCYLIYCNLVGTELNLVFWGGSRVVDPRGEIIGEIEPYKEGTLLVDIDMDVLKFSRKMRPTLRDTQVSSE